ncbi:MAG: hypothetical protein A3A72_00755 [Deltaproteobacteria bacterium RIFCSPLOWO2_01_FULL_38_9]|nr:MAG: hypothetical protein A3A72_00755 [Deltaproteobacteria bacterium RIFCSPLOWO2_01_FULL_38_9]
MKKILFMMSLFVCGMGVFLFSPNIYTTEEEGCSVTVNGVTKHFKDPAKCDEAQRQEAARLKAEKEAAQKEAENPILDTKGTAQWSAYDADTKTTTKGGDYATGGVKVKDEWSSKTSAGIKLGGMQMAGAVNQAASTMIKDPKAAGITTGVVSGAAGAADFAAAGQYNKLSDQYWSAWSQNAKLRDQNKGEIARIDTRLATLNKFDQKKTDPKVWADIVREKEELGTAKTAIEAELTKQKDLISEQRSGWLSNKMANYAGRLGGAAMVYMGAQNYEQGRRLANESKFCKENPKDVQCGGTGIPDEGKPVDCTKPENISLPDCGGPVTTSTPTPLPEGWTPDSGGDPFGTTPGNGAGSDGLSANAAGIGGGGRSGGDPSFLGGGGGGGMGGGSPTDGAKPESEFGGGYSGDQAYGSSGGGADSSSEPLMSIDFGGGPSPAGSPDGFDISQFFPGAEGPEDQSAMVALGPNGQPVEQKNKLLGDKDSPSLFTRVTKAHQKKAHELVQEVLF